MRVETGAHTGAHTDTHTKTASYFISLAYLASVNYMIEKYLKHLS